MQKHIKTDIFIVIVTTALGYFASVSFSFAEWYYALTADWEVYELDESIFMLLFLSVALIWFSHRRVDEYRDLLATNLTINEQLMLQNEDIKTLSNKNLAMVNRIVSIRENEREYLAAELHDIFGQHLAAIDANIQTAQYLVEPNSELHGLLQQTLESSQFLSKITREKLHELRPPNLALIGLTSTVEDLVSQWHLSFKNYALKLNIAIDDNAISEDVGLTLYRAIQESLVNITRHADANSIEIDLNSSNDNIILILRDNGKGLDPDLAIGKGIGLIAMRERCNTLDGDFSISTIKPHGTQIKLSLPSKSSLNMQGEKSE